MESFQKKRVIILLKNMMEISRKYFKNVINYLGIKNENEFIEIVNQHRNEEIWLKDRKSNSGWNLRSKIEKIEEKNYT